MLRTTQSKDGAYPVTYETRIRVRSVTDTGTSRWADGDVLSIYCYIKTHKECGRYLPVHRNQVAANLEHLVSIEPAQQTEPTCSNTQT